MTTGPITTIIMTVIITPHDTANIAVTVIIAGIMAIGAIKDIADIKDTVVIAVIRDIVDTGVIADTAAIVDTGDITPGIMAIAAGSVRAISLRHAPWQDIRVTAFPSGG
jgi:hypothetical protein